jgi:retron-type reverse transcriptase
MVPLFKKGDKEECGNYRTISLISHASKILLKIMKSRMSRKLKEDIPDEQMGFRPGRGCRDLMVGLQVIIDKHDVLQDRGFTMTFIDYKKAFDKVDHSVLIDVLRRRGYPSDVINLVESLYRGATAQVRWNDRRTGAVELGCGVRQGCVLSPDLFVVYGEEITDRAGSQDAIVIGGGELTI